MDNLMIFMLAIITIPIFIVMMLIPYWTRKTESFGVSIPEKIYGTSKLKKMRKQYAVSVGVLSVLFIGLFALLSSIYNSDENMVAIVYSVVIILYLLTSFFIYLYFHRKMKELKRTENWAQEKEERIVIDTKFRQQQLIYSNRWFIISFVISLITVVLTLQFYQLFPDKIPMQYNFSGKVTNWADKTYRSVFLFPSMQVYMTLLFLFINTIIAKAKQQVSAENPESSMIQNITFRRRWSLFIIITSTAFVVLFGMIQISFFYPMNQMFLFITSLVINFGMLIGVIVLSFTTGQGGSRIKTGEDKNGNVIDRDDDQYWILGQFYFNKEDPSLFLEKRFGVGWTNNWARPLSWIILLAIILLAAGIPILLTI